MHRANDLNIFYRDYSVIDDMAHSINDTFQTKNQSLSTMRGNVHNFLGIVTYYFKADYVTFTMYNFLKDILNEVDEGGDMRGTSIIPTCFEQIVHRQ